MKKDFGLSEAFTFDAKNRIYFARDGLAGDEVVMYFRDGAYTVLTHLEDYSHVSYVGEDMETAKNVAEYQAKMYV